MVKDNFYIVHIIKGKRDMPRHVSLSFASKKMKGRETSYSEAEIV